MAHKNEDFTTLSDLLDRMRQSTENGTTFTDCTAYEPEFGSTKLLAGKESQFVRSFTFCGSGPQDGDICLTLDFQVAVRLVDVLHPLIDAGAQFGDLGRPRFAYLFPQDSPNGMRVLAGEIVESQCLGKYLHDTWEDALTAHKEERKKNRHRSCRSYLICKVVQLYLVSDPTHTEMIFRVRVVEARMMSIA